MSLAMPKEARILLVEDDVALADLVAEYLSDNGFEVAVVGDGQAAVHRLQRENFGLVVLDLMLPKLDGYGVCKAARPDFSGPILMLTARDDDFDEVAALEMGADDYVRKPVRPRVLLARIRSLLRRSRGEATAKREEVVVGELRIVVSSRAAFFHGEELELSTAEFDLLLMLTRCAGEVVGRESLYRALRGIGYNGIDRSLDVRISRLRRKLGAEGRALIKTVRGEGYLYVN